MTLSIAPYKTRLNHGNAYWMARLSNVVYMKKKNNVPDSNEILKNLQEEDPGFIAVTPYSVDDTQAIFVEHKQYLCMAFRGTDELGDWIDNLNMGKDPLDEDNHHEVHQGFLHQLDDIWDDIEKKYNECNEKDPRPLFFTGHSLGGAIATIATARWVLNGDRQFTSTYTFGQPRAVTLDTSRTLASMYGARFFRFHNNNDMVPRVPFRATGFSHMGQILYIDKDKEIHTDPGFWYRFQDQVKGVIEAKKGDGIDFFADHNMDEYLFAVRNWDLQD